MVVSPWNIRSIIPLNAMVAAVISKRGRRTVTGWKMMPITESSDPGHREPDSESTALIVPGNAYVLLARFFPAAFLRDDLPAPSEPVPAATGSFVPTMESTTPSMRLSTVR